MKKVTLLSLFLLNGLVLSAQLYVEGVLLDATNTSAYLEATPLRRNDGT
ncbi:MAG: hypothetical protein JNL32_16800, partial [Candidatus Kapabacteria bacterium]|nr:hypothetical protein [Candidatus Kapabacteria bacterium]